MVDKKKKLSTRRLNRIAAMQFLYAWEINASSDINQQIRIFFNTLERDRSFYEFAEYLLQGAIPELLFLDQVIREIAVNWKFDRIAKIDLAILRLAIYELKFCREIPPVVTVNEAIELGKMFSQADSKRFINGILDKLIKQLDRPTRQASR